MSYLPHFTQGIVLCVGLLSIVEVVCGQYGFCLWPIWYRLWPMWSVADLAVADMVCGRYRRNSQEMMSLFQFPWRMFLPIRIGKIR